MSGKKPKFQSIRAMGIAATITSYLVGPILAGVFVGRWLDGYFDTAPLFLIIGLLLGLGSGIFGLIRVVQAYLGDK